MREIALWIAERAQDRELAKRFVTELRQACERLRTFPNAGAIPRDRVLKSAGFRFVSDKDYRIFYLVDEENLCVNVMAVFNGKQDYMRIMRKFF